jgi:hypothetical protein
MVGLLTKKGKGYYLFPSIGKAAANPEILFQLTTRKKFKIHGFAVTCKACDRALALCPNASEPVWIKEKAEDKDYEKWKRRRNAMQFIQSAGKWTGLAVAGVIALAHVRQLRS